MKIEFRKFLPINATVLNSVLKERDNNGKRILRITVGVYQATKTDPDNFYKPVSKMIKIVK